MATQRQQKQNKLLSNECYIESYEIGPIPMFIQIKILIVITTMWIKNMRKTFNLVDKT